MNRTPKTISIIDDDPSVRRSLGVLFECTGFHVVTFESAEDFLERDCLHEIDVLIVDMRLPGISGLQLLESVTALGWTGPSFIVTGNAELVDVDLPTLHDGIHLLTKPSDPNKLLDVIHAELDLRR